MALANITVRSTGTTVSNLAANVNPSITLKNAPLTHEEVDLNFLEIADDVSSLLSSSVTTFTGLSDTPTNFTGSANYFLKVNTGGTAVEFVADPGYLTSETFTSLVQDTTPQLGGTLDANGNNIDMGSNTITDTKVAQWDTAYGWGDHSTAGYLTTETSHADVLVDGDFASAGIMATDGSGSYSTVTDNSANWNTAYGWGDHSAAGYITDITAQALTSLSDVDAVAGAGDDGKVLYYDHATTSFKWKVDASGLALTDFSVTTGTASAGGSLSYDNSTGVFTFRPAASSLGTITLTSLASNDILKYNGAAWVNQPEIGEQSFSIETADFTATSGSRYGVDTTAGSVTATLPATPATGDAIRFAQSGGDWTTNNFIINPNGNNINGSSGNYTHSINLDFSSLGVFYNGTEWRKYS